MKKTYTQSTEEVLSELQVGLEGLTSAEAKARQEKYGPNKLKEGEKPTLLQRFLAQLKDPMLTILSYIIGNSFEVGHFVMPVGVSEHGMTMAFLTMSMCEIFHSFNLRSQRKSIFSLKTQNKILWLAMIGSLLLTTAILEIPFLANAFGFTPVGLTEYGIAMVLAILVIPIVEVVKFFQRKLGK